MGEQRVGAQRTVEAELEAFVGGDRRHAVDDLLRPFGPAELPRVRLADGLRLAQRGRGVELERPEHVVDIDVAGELVERLLEPALADVAPRAHDVAPDVDTDRRSGGCHAIDVRPVSSTSMSVDVGRANATACAAMVDE